jgi:gliding motility-associated-like protein
VELSRKKCKIFDTILVSKAPEPRLRNDTSICANDSLPISELSGVMFSSYLWNNGSKTKNTVAMPGRTYMLVTTYRNPQCRDSATVHIGSRKVPYFDLGADTSMCKGQSRLLKADIPGASYRWQDGYTGSSFLVTAAGLYKLRVRLGDCYYEDEIVVNEADIPNGSLDDSIVFCGRLNEVADAGNPGSTYYWNTGEKTRTIKLQKAGLYRVLIVNSQGCRAVDSIRAIAKKEHPVFLPNAITPNRDGRNDMFPQPWQDYSFSLQVYNRWGEKLYEGDKAWNGEYRDEVVEEGVYLFIMTYNTCLGIAESRSKNI